MTLHRASGLTSTLRDLVRYIRDRGDGAAIDRADADRDIIEKRLSALAAEVERIVADTRVPARVHRLAALRLAVDDLMVAAVTHAGFDTSTLHVPLSEADRSAVTAYLHYNGWPAPPRFPGASGMVW